MLKPTMNVRRKIIIYAYFESTKEFFFLYFSIGEIEPALFAE